MTKTRYKAINLIHKYNSLTLVYIPALSVSCRRYKPDGCIILTESGPRSIRMKKRFVPLRPVSNPPNADTKSNEAIVKITQQLNKGNEPPQRHAVGGNEQRQTQGSSSFKYTCLYRKKSGKKHKNWEG